MADNAQDTARRRRIFLIEVVGRFEDELHPGDLATFLDTKLDALAEDVRDLNELEGVLVHEVRPNGQLAAKQLLDTAREYGGLFLTEDEY